MSRYKIRQQVPVTIGGETHQIWVRELPYQQFIDINSGNGLKLEELSLGMEIMRTLCVLAIEEQDGSKSYTRESWKEEPLSAMTALYYAVCKVHGVDLEKLKPAAEITEEDIEGNAEPSKTSGTNSASSAAAQSQN